MTPSADLRQGGDLRGLTGRLRIGFTGLGQMGGPMVRRLRGRGWEITAYDIAPEARRRLDGEDWVSVVDNAGPLARSDVVITMLPDSDAVEDVLVSSRLGARLRPGAAVIDMSSSDPRRTRKLADMLRARGVTLLDAPVSGGVERAAAGSLNIMVGGAEPDVTAWRPLLASFGTKIVRVGEVGAGHAAKSLNNLLSATALLVTGEALCVASRFGLDPVVLVSALNGASGRNSATDQKFPGYVFTGTFASGFSASLMAKDVAIAMSLARETGTDTPVATEVEARWSMLAGRLAPCADHTEVIRVQEEDCGVRLRAPGAPDGPGAADGPGAPDGPPAADADGETSSQGGPAAG